MSANNKIGAKCLKNLHLNLNEKGILEDIAEVEEVSSDEEKDEEGKDEKGEEKEEEKQDQETVHSATTEKAVEEQEQGEAMSKGEASREGDGEELQEHDFDDSSSDEEVLMPVKKEPVLTPRKSSRLASKRPVGMDEEMTSHSTLEPTNAPPSTKPATPSPSSPIPFTPPPFTTHVSPPHTSPGFDDTAYPSTVPIASLDLILSKLNDLQSRFFAFQDELRVSLASITDQLSQMESHLGVKLDTVEVQTEFVDDEETAA